MEDYIKAGMALKCVKNITIEDGRLVINTKEGEIRARNLTNGLSLALLQRAKD